MVTVMVLYPQPNDEKKFKEDYKAHLQFLHEKMNIPLNPKPYEVLRFFPGPDGKAPYYQSWSMPFESMEALNTAMASKEMQDVAADANRISSGGAPVILIGQETNIL